MAGRDDAAEEDSTMAQLKGSFRLGALTIHHLSDGSDAQPRASWFHGIDPAEWVAALGLEGPEHVFGRTLGGVFAITGDGHVTLVETGNGVNAKGRPGLEGGGELLDRLQEIGIRRGDVDRIFQTHLHGDHCG